MNLSNLEGTLNTNAIGHEIYQLVAKLYPICTSISGDGLRQSLNIVKKHIPIEVHEVPSGTQVFDWTVPKEWNIRDAYVKNARGERLIDFKTSALHVVNYSIPIKARVTLAELKEHLYTLPDHPDWIPYRTSYYKESWGFCLTHKKFLELQDEEYEVLIDASLENGHLTHGEYYLKGERLDEVLISCHVCHPSMCNDNLSGVALAAILAKYLSPLSLRYSYRFLFTPGAIGSITWLCQNESRASKIKHGLVTACMGDSGSFTYKKSRRGDAEIDKTVTHILKQSGKKYDLMDFSPYGFDERHFGSPGFNLPVGCLMRTPYELYPEYHTSADNLDFVQPQYLADSFAKVVSVLRVLENNRKYLNQNPKCEPQLGKRGLYRAIGGQSDGRTNELAMLWVLNLSDGGHTLLDIAERSGISFNAIEVAADRLLKHDLLKEYQP